MGICSRTTRKQGGFSPPQSRGASLPPTPTRGPGNRGPYTSPRKAEKNNPRPHHPSSVSTWDTSAAHTQHRRAILPPWRLGKGQCGGAPCHIALPHSGL